MKTFAVAIQSEFVDCIFTNSGMMLEDVTPIIATTWGLNQTEVIEKVSGDHKIPAEILVAFELVI